MKCWSLPDNIFTNGTPVLQMTWDNRDSSIWEVRKLSESISTAEIKNTIVVYYDAGMLNVQSTGGLLLADLSVFNALGEMIRYAQGIGNTDFSFPINMNPGIYFVRATMTDGETANNKFIRL